MPDGPIAIVLAAGVGARLGSRTPKQFLEIDGIPVLARTVSAFAWCQRVLVVHHPEYRARTQEVLDLERLGSHVELVPGGATRRHSVAAAVDILEGADGGAAVVLQNAASPNTPRELVQNCLDELGSHEVVQAYVPAAHTVFRHAGDELMEVLPRNKLGYTADPTVYRLGTLRRITVAQAAGAGEMTIDTARRLGIPVRLVPSPAKNIKLTTVYDLAVLQALAAEGGAQSLEED